MKIVKLVPIAMFVSLAACDQFTNSEVETVEEVAELSTLEQKVSYLMGMQSAASTSAIELDQAAYDSGFSDGLAGNPPAISEEVIAETVAASPQLPWQLLHFAGTADVRGVELLLHLLLPLLLGCFGSCCLLLH